MCQMFAGQPPESYEYQTRSIRLHGHSTSIRLESTFWRLLEHVAREQGMSLPKFITTLHDEVVELHGSATNFTSLLRCATVVHLESVRAAPRDAAPRQHAASQGPTAAAVVSG
jgi:predicted DNA-binding ribbon-helix-helix protein